MNALNLSITLLLSLVQGIALHYQPSTVALLLGREYTKLPKGLCEGSAEVLIGEASGHEYIGLICNQASRSYIVLQQLVGYTDSQTAILKAVDIKALPVLQTGEISINQGCAESSQPSAAIIAIVRDIGQPTYQTIKAWKANLQTEQFEELNPQIVACRRPWL